MLNVVSGSQSATHVRGLQCYKQTSSMLIRHYNRLVYEIQDNLRQTL